MDAATGMGYPMTGFSIRYEFGIFKQKIVDGWQMEFPDNWLEMGDVWLQAREDDAVEVKFGGEVREWMDNDRFKVAQVGYSSVMAVPYDMYISGYDSDAANRLVLWSAKLPQSLRHGCVLPRRLCPRPGAATPWPRPSRRSSIRRTTTSRASACA